MRTILASALAVSALAVGALPAAAAPACDKVGGRTLHTVEDKAGPAGGPIHTVEGVYCGSRLP